MHPLSPRAGNRLAAAILVAALGAAATGCGGPSGGPPDAFRSIDLVPSLLEAGGSPPLAADVDVEVAVLDFARAEDRASVLGGPNTASSRYEDGVLRYDVTGVDNRWSWRAGVEAPEITHVVIRGLRVQDAQGPVHLVWQRDDQGPDAWHHAAFTVSFDGEAHDAVVAVEDSPHWTGRIARMGLRFGARKAARTGPFPIRLDRIEYRRMDLGTRRAREGLPGDIERLAIDRESRRVVHAPAPSELAIPVEIPPRARLAFGIGVHPGAVTKRGDGVRFRVRFEDRVLFERTLDPRARAEDRAWHDVSLDLGELAGRDGTLRFETDPLDSREYDEALWAHPVVVAGDHRELPAPAKRPNLLLVSLDTVRADHLSLYGYEHETSPELDRLAGDAFVFERASAPAPETVSSHMSLFTSLHPTAHGIRQVFEPYRLSARRRTLAEVLHEDGYATAAFTEGGGMHYSVGFDRGFDRYSIGEIQPKRPQKMLEGISRNARAWLRENADRRFFLFVHSYEAHTPYDPPAPHDTMFFRGEYEGAIDPPISAEKVEQLVIQGRLRHDDPNRGVERVVSLYDGAIHYLDRHLGGLLDEVRRLQLREDTVVVVFSDHGEDFFDHFSIATHGHSLYEELMHVPLVIRVPGTRGRRIPDEVSLVDLMPTVLEVLGLEAESGLQGRSFEPLLRGGALPEAPVYLEDPTGIVRYGIRLGRHKWICSPGVRENPIYEVVQRFSEPIGLDRFEGIFQEHELYDLEKDAAERHNLLVGAEPEAAKVLRESVVELKARNVQILGAAPPERGGAVSAEMVSRLEALGYADDGGSGRGDNPPADACEGTGREKNR